jgi:prepilin-type N-terminal cleavage/methylation domain-containing protein
MPTETVFMSEQNGMSLIETLISLAILSFGAVAFTQMQMNMTLATQTSRQRAEAVSLAKNKIELFRGTGGCDTAESGTFTPLQGNTTYTVTVTCASTKTPTVKITWLDSRGGQPQSGGSAVANNVELSTTLE